jgi:predicted transcriptional regulator
MPSSKRIQIIVRVSADTAARLDNLSASYDKKGGRTQVAEEILAQCVDLYEESEIAKFNVLRRTNCGRCSDTE